MEDSEARVVDLASLARGGDQHGFLWSQQTDDLNLNLFAIGPDTGIAEHINAEVDVLLVPVEGEGDVSLDGESQQVSPGKALVIPKGARRAIRTAHGRFVYLTCHRRRGGLWPQGLPRHAPGSQPKRNAGE